MTRNNDDDEQCKTRSHGSRNPGVHMACMSHRRLGRVQVMYHTLNYTRGKTGSHVTSGHSEYSETLSNSERKSKSTQESDCLR